MGHPLIHLTIEIVTNDKSLQQRLIDFSDGEIGLTFTRNDFTPDAHIADVKTTGRGVTTAELLGVSQEELDQWEQDDAEDDEDNFTYEPNPDRDRSVDSHEEI